MASNFLRIFFTYVHFLIVMHFLWINSSLLWFLSNFIFYLIFLNFAKYCYFPLFMLRLFSEACLSYLKVLWRFKSRKLRKEKNIKKSKKNQKKIKNWWIKEWRRKKSEWCHGLELMGALGDDFEFGSHLFTYFGSSCKSICIFFT